MTSNLPHWIRLSVLFMKPFQMIVEHAIQLRFMLCYYVMAQEVGRLCAFCWLFGDLWTPFKLQNMKYAWAPDRHIWAVWQGGCKLVPSELAYSSCMHRIALGLGKILLNTKVHLFLISHEIMKYMNSIYNIKYICILAKISIKVLITSTEILITSTESAVPRTPHY